jgi:hypothetical protein
MESRILPGSRVGKRVNRRSAAIVILGLPGVAVPFLPFASGNSPIGVLDYTSDMFYAESMWLAAEDLCVLIIISFLEESK